VRVRDLSANGARIEAARPPEAGSRVLLEFPALLGRPTVAAVVRHVSATDRRLGVEFEPGTDTPAKIAEELTRSFSTGPRV
jgi:hypothetical protein